MSRWGPSFLKAFNTIIVNNTGLLKILIKDKTSSGAKVPVRFLHSVIHAQPAIEPENFQHCPVALYHPEEDMWTPIEVSKIFFDRIKVRKKLRSLKMPDISRLKCLEFSSLKSIPKIS